MAWKGSASGRKALLGLLMCGALSILWASYIALHASSGAGAFKGFYYGARCLIEHRDPYSPSTLQQVYAAEGGSFPADAADARFFQSAMLVYVNLPTPLFLLAPLAMLPWRMAAVAWMALNAAGLVGAALLMWRVAGEIALKPATLLICLLLANTEIVLALGNLAALAVSLCVIAVWCFMEERFTAAGVICLALSLVFKPHDGGLVWLYFLLAGGVQRKRALQSLGVAAVLALPALLWVWAVSPHWLTEMHENLQALSARGNVNDPGPDSLTFRSADHVISLQALFALVRDDPRFYNLASYLTCGLLLVAGAVRAMKSRFSKENAWLALAAMAALSMLPVYHRAYDAKLLMLVVPACALLWREGGRMKWLAGVLTTLAMLSTADVTASFLLGVMNGMQGSLKSGTGRLLTAFVFHPDALVLLATGVFYLWAYFLRTGRERAEWGEQP